MKKIYFMLLSAACCFSAAQAQSVATFEDLGLGIDQYWDGSDESAMFVSGGYTFINNFVDWGGYTSWDGFAYSTMTSTNYAQLSDQYNSCVGHGVNESRTYAVVYYSPFMGTEPTVIENNAETFTAVGCYVTNAAYAYESMKNGDSYAKKFDESDWFLLTATGYKGEEVSGTAEFYLAKDGNIVNTWEYFDLSSLGEVDEIHFTLTSSDTGTWGMNTPAYFCMDNFGASNNTTALNQMRENCAKGQRYDIMGRACNDAKGLQVVEGRVILNR